MASQAINKEKAEKCIEELAEWFAKYRRPMPVKDMRPLAEEYFGTGEELTEFYEYLASPEGGELFKKQLRLQSWELGLAGPTPEEKEPKFVRPYGLFYMGRLVFTRGVNDLVAENEEFAKFVRGSIGRHSRGDWGDLPEEDKKENEYALGRHLRLFSAYIKPPLRKIWIITEADRSATTILFPEEY